jgi:hypothetical protein
MSQDFTGKSSPELDRLIAECTSAEQIREVTKTYLENEGVLSRDRREANFGGSATGQSLPSEMIRDEEGRAMCVRVVRLPGGRSFKISGYSEAAIDQLEATLRGQ